MQTRYSQSLQLREGVENPSRQRLQADIPEVPLVVPEKKMGGG